MPFSKPIIGLAGGIGSGKSLVASLFGELGCLVVDSDAQVSAAYQLPEVQQTLISWWGHDVVLPDGRINRSLIASRIFSDLQERLRLEKLLHPIVATERDRLMMAHANDPAVLAFVWDVPLLFETGLNSQCNAVVFVETSLDERLARVVRTRSWSTAELARRENSQFPLDRKRQMSDYVINNRADVANVRSQIQDVFRRIIAKTDSDRTI